jgi:hypothetical protein
MTPQQIASALGKPHRVGREWKCLCPCHNDTDPSLSIIEKAGKLLVTCRAGCDQDLVVDTLKKRGLWTNGHDPRPGSFHIDKTYDYTDEDGQLLFQVCRLLPKDFRQRRPNGTGKWEWTTAGTRMVPYHLTELLAALTNPSGPDPPRVYVVEGEKDADFLRSQWGLLATTNPGGAGKWRHDFAQYFRGLDVVVLPDNDDAGLKHAQDVARNLAPVAASVRIVALDGLPDKGDVCDWIANGGGQPDLEALVDTTAPFIPGPPAPPNDPSGGAVGQLIAEFNPEYCVVNEDGKVWVFQWRDDPILERQVLDRISFADFKKMYQNRRIDVVSGNKIVSKTAADLWLNHPARRQYLAGVIFDPYHPAPPGFINLWRGFAFPPAPGNWSDMHDHIKSVLCSGVQEHFEYLMNWAALMFQQPGRQGEVAVVIRGTKGCGKGIFFQCLRKAWGQHGVYISNAKHLTGNFNAHLRDCVFLFADEAFFASDRQHEGILKGLVTDPVLPIEAKRQNLVLVANRLHIGMASNSDWVIPASHDERRYFMMNASDHRVGQFNYFKKYRRADGRGRPRRHGLEPPPPRHKRLQRPRRARHGRAGRTKKTFTR